MKKVTSLAAALCMATAFCGFCTACAKNAATPEVNNDSTPVATVSAAASDTPKVILSPGWYYDTSKKQNVDNGIETGAKVTALTDADEKVYWVDNAYFANYTVGEDLPKATTTRSGMTFVGWRYAVDGEMVVVDKMPAVNGNDILLYAQWQCGEKPSSGPITPGPTPTPGPDDPVGSSSYYVVGTINGASEWDAKTHNLVPTAAVDGAKATYTCTLTVSGSTEIKVRNFDDTSWYQKGWCANLATPCTVATGGGKYDNAPNIKITGGNGTYTILLQVWDDSGSDVSIVVRKN